MNYPAVFRSHEYEDPELEEDEDERERIIEENARRAIWRVFYANQIPQVGTSADFVDEAYELGEIHGAPVVLIDDEDYGWKLVLPLFMDDDGDLQTWRGDSLTESQQERIMVKLKNESLDEFIEDLEPGESVYFPLDEFGDAESIEDGIAFAEEMIATYPRRRRNPARSYHVEASGDGYVVFVVPGVYYQSAMLNPGTGGEVAAVYDEFGQRYNRYPTIEDAQQAITKHRQTHG